MFLLYPFLSILAETTGKTIDKLNFRRNHIATRQLMWLVFVSMFLAIGALLLITKQPFPVLSQTALIFIVAIGVVSFVANVLDFMSLKTNDLSLREPMVNFKPILAGLIGYALFPDQRQPIYLAAFLVGGLIVVWGSRRRRLGRVQKRGLMYLGLSVVLYATLPSIYQATLPYINPTYIAFFRVAAVLAFSFIVCSPRYIRKITRPQARYGLGSGFVYAIGAVAGLYMLQEFGVVVSTLFVMLEPALKYLASHFVLKEHVQRGEIMASGVLGIIIVLTLLVK